ncbi:hypothetical protein [Rhodohalobacter halophilus]|uniref:hypothetical protein n=1 Tax=Rhodohalobacter halophilus TaxID=1812810 RepID=UPI00083F8B94|nr:hypothetical protein [Rhodohalobacter halophilus]
MAGDGSCLGVSYADNHLFYSVNDPETENHLKHIGSIDFNFDVQQAIITGDKKGFPALQTSLENLKETYGCSTVKILSPAVEECWTIVPRSVYEDSAEREAHISLLMHGIDRSRIETTWIPVSNVDYKLLLLRNREAMQGFNHLLGSFQDSEYVAEFEIGADWQNHSRENGSFMKVYCQKNYISAASFILGKLRGCTFLRYDTADDLPYLWNLYADKLSWMNGLHDSVYVYGEYATPVSDALNTFWGDAGKIQSMNSLKIMGVDADEKTYGFRLESAYPAIIMSLNKDAEIEEPAT